MFGAKIKYTDDTKNTASDMDQQHQLEHQIRKVRSLDFARYKASLSHAHNALPLEQPCCKASKFSHAAQRGTYSDIR